MKFYLTRKYCGQICNTLSGRKSALEIAKRDIQQTGIDPRLLPEVETQYLMKDEQALGFGEVSYE